MTRRWEGESDRRRGAVRVQGGCAAGRAAR